MRFVGQLDDDEVRVLEAVRRTAVGRVSQRTHMVLLSNRHYCIAEIARVFDASENTVRQWIERYERDGVDWLDDRPRSGKPPSTRMPSSLLPSLGKRLPSGLRLACAFTLHPGIGPRWARRQQCTAFSEAWASDTSDRGTRPNGHMTLRTRQR